MQVRWLFWLVAVTLCFQSLSAQANDTKTVLKYDPSGSSGWRPYYIESDPPTGILVDLLDYVLRSADIEGAEVNLPPKRTVYALRNGLIDFDLVSPAWFPKGYDLTPYVFSDAILPIVEHVIHMPKSNATNLTFSSNNDAKPVIATVRGYYYHNDDQFIRMDFQSEKDLILALQKQRLEFGICGVRTAKYWAKTLGLDIQLGPMHSKGYLHMRLLKKHEDLLPVINRGIQQLISSGQLDRIIDKY